MFIIRNLIKTKQGSFPFALSNLLKCGTNSMFGNCLSTLSHSHSQLRRLVHKAKRKLPAPANFSSRRNQEEKEEESRCGKDDKCCRLVFISDTHSVHERLGVLPAGDVLIHAGDFSRARPAKPGEYKDFLDWLVAQPHKHKVLISGNRDQLMDSAAKVRVIGRGCHLKFHQKSFSFSTNHQRYFG